MDQLGNKSKNAFKWSFLGNISGQFFAFAFSIFLARLLTPTQFGLIAIVNVLLAFSETFSDIGLGTSILQRKEINKSHLGSVFWFNITMGLLLALVFNIFAKQIATYYNEPQLLNIIRAMSIIVIINSFSKVINARLQRELSFKVPVISSIIGTIISGSIGVYFAFQGLGVWALVLQAISFAFIKNSLIIIFAKVKPEFAFSFKALKELWEFGFSMFLTGLADTIYKNVDALIIGKLFPTYTLGQYNRSKYLSTLISANVITSLNSILLPTLAKTQDDTERFKRIVIKILSLFSFISFFVFGLSFVLGKDMILIVFGDQWDVAVKYFRIVILSALAFPLDVIIKNIITSLGQARFFLKMELLKKIPLTINLLLGFIYGIEGFLYGLIIASFLNLFITILFAKKSLKVSVRFFVMILMPYALIAIFTTSCTWFLFDFLNERLFLHAILAGVTYVVLFVFLNFVFKTPGQNLFFNEIKNNKQVARFVKVLKNRKFKN